MLNDHEKGLVDEIIAKDRFVSVRGDNNEEDVPDNVKAAVLLSDSTSGGQNANPYWVDENIITAQLLYGELLP